MWDGMHGMMRMVCMGCIVCIVCIACLQNSSLHLIRSDHSQVGSLQDSPGVQVKMAQGEDGRAGGKNKGSASSSG